MHICLFNYESNLVQYLLKSSHLVLYGRVKEVQSAL
jgi:hypothetical protein